MGPDHGGIRAAGEELAHGEAERGVDEAGRDLGQRLEHEAPLVQARVGNHEAGSIAPLVPEEQDVDVDRARAVPLRAHAPHLALGGEARLEERLGTERRLSLRRQVQEPALGRPPHGLREPERAAPRHAEAASDEPPEGAIERGLAVAQVGAETEKDRRAHVPPLSTGLPPGATGV